MKTEKLIPFDLTTALAHPEHVRTRDGRKVVGLVDDRKFTYFPGHALSAFVPPCAFRCNFYCHGAYVDNLDSHWDLMLTEPQPDANGWYKIGEIRPPKNTAVTLGRMRGAFDKAEGWYEAFADNVRDDLSMWTHWRYPKPPVELEKGK